MFKRQRASGNFWAWLEANTARIQSSRNGVPDVADELSHAFKRSYSELTWEITPANAGSWLFCVSADGNKELFDQVESAVAEAPRISGWKIRAFRQRGPLDAVIEFEDQKLSYDDIWCEVEPNGRRASVKLLVRGLNLENAEALLGAALVLLDNAVGEYDSVTKILDLDNGALPKKPVRSKTMFPLSELPEYFDRLGQDR